MKAHSTKTSVKTKDAIEAAKVAARLIHTMYHEPDDHARILARVQLHERAAELITRILGIEIVLPEQKVTKAP